MPTKKELLEEKTVDDLKQMARDKDLSGYSNMVKGELIDLINENYLKREIKEWPDLEEEEEETEEETVEEEPAEEVDTGIKEVETEEVETEDIEPSGMVDVEKDIGKVPEPSPEAQPEEEVETFKNIVTGVIIGVVILIIIVVLYFQPWA